MSNIGSLKKEDGTWTWSHEGTLYRTNSEGEGIWEYRPDGTWSVAETPEGIKEEKQHYSWKKIAGTCDFWLRDMSVSGARKKLNRHFAEEV